MEHKTDDSLLLLSSLLVNNTRVYTKRWLILGLFISFSISNAFLYPQYEIIANILVGYYNVSSLAIFSTALCYMVTYITFSLPGLYILENFGTRRTVIIGMVGITIGAWIRVIGVQPNRFWLAFVGQCIASVPQVLVLPLPPKIAAIWFGDHEVATACSLGTAGSAVGMLLGFLMTPLFVQNGTVEKIENGLYVNCVVSAVICTLTGIAIYLFFEEFPPTPPSAIQLKALRKRNISKTKFWKSFKNLTTNKSFMLLSMVYGFNTALLFPYSVFINNIMLHYYPNAPSIEISTIGSLGVAGLAVGCITGGLLTDKYKNYQFLLLLFVGLNMCVVLLLCLFFGCTLWIFNVLVLLLGFTCGATFPVGYEIGIELTYPEPEGISGGILSCSFQMFAVILCLCYYMVYTSLGFAAGNWILFGLLVVVDLVLIFVKFDLQRQSTTNSIKFTEVYKQLEKA